jgi:Protein of unknown function (DUF4236)
MGWRFRRSFKIIPGVKLNLSKSGLSCSVGGAPVTLNVGPRGVYGTASLPGTGISYRQRFGGSEAHQPDSSVPPFSTPHSFPPPPSTPGLMPVPVSAMPVQEIRSASTELLTSESLKELKRVIQTAYEEHEDISGQLQAARKEKEKASRRCLSWLNRFLLKRFFKAKFEQRKADLETAEAKVAELEEQLRLTTVATQVEIAREQAEPYFKMRDGFASLCECAVIWDVKSHRATDKLRERTTAETRVDREKVTFGLGSCDLIQWEQKVPHFKNAKSGDLFLYPGFILYRAATEAFSVIDFHDVRPTALAVSFQEEQGVPPDSKVIGQTWAKANKDGSRDRRFANNTQIPVVLYASLTLKSSTGLWEEFQFSNPERLQQFLQTWNGFVLSFGVNRSPA